MHLIVQASRLHDGSRKITHVSEIMGQEGDTIVLQDIFTYEIGTDIKEDGKVSGKFVTPGLSNRSVVYRKAIEHGCEGYLKAIFG